MIREDHLLLIVEEEAGEIAQASLRVAQAASKALRFGLDDGYPGTDRTNREDLVKEVNDLLGTLELLQEQGVELPGLFDRGAIDAKKAKVERYLNYSRAQGRLTD